MFNVASALAEWEAVGGRMKVLVPVSGEEPLPFGGLMRECGVPLEPVAGASALRGLLAREAGVRILLPASIRKFRDALRALLDALLRAAAGYSTAGNEEVRTVLYANGTEACFVTALLWLLSSRLRRAYSGLVWHVRDLQPFFSPLRVLAWLPRLLLCNSPATAASLGSLWASRTEVLPNCLRLDSWDEEAGLRIPARIEAFLQFHRRAGRLVALTVAHFAALKGLHSMVEALGGLRGEEGVPPMAWVHVGGCRYEGSRAYAERLAARVHELGLDEYVLFAGELDRIAALERKVDLYVCSSEREGFSRATLEAMASSLPVVATAVGGLPFLLGAVGSTGTTALSVPGDGRGVVRLETGFLVAGSEPDSIGEGLRAALDAGKDELRMMGGAARRMVERRFSHEAFGRRLRTLLRGMWR